MTNTKTLAVGLSLLALLAGTALAQRVAPGIAGRPAPSWGVSEWINLAEGSRSLDVTDLKGTVVFMLGFQSWCPGCHSRGFPTLKQLIKTYAGVDDVSFVAVQTVFEGFSTNTAQRAWETAHTCTGPPSMNSLDQYTRPPSWGRTRPVTVDSGQKQASATWDSGGERYTRARKARLWSRATVKWEMSV